MSIRWKLWIMGAAVATVLVSGCSSEKTEVKTEKPQQVDQKPAQPSPDPVKPPANSGNVFPESATGGFVEGFEFGIGDHTGDVLRQWGEPEHMEYWAGGLYLSYPQVVLFTDARLDNEDHVIDGTVREMGFRPGTDLFGAKVGQTFAEIEAVLGSGYVKHSPDDNKNNEFYGEMWSIEYDLGSYLLVFSGEQEEGPTDSAYYMLK
ncbi:DUF4309 domain-containing protein [Paenibacillus sp. SYP-B4298]|uniref:DUF4309 domain-containing protein n=1 Tax=Paenibacillus sp. SYP-B4298 TaxID=2996034 RepID=UPI0022DE5CB1|nr:DUF4309 domain-containing protein [Paenibacillus sp. SYP-B4298]